MRFSLPIALLVATALASPIAYARLSKPEECGNTNLSDPGKSMSSVKVKDQDGSGYCTAYAASEMYDAWRASKGILTKPTSPIAVAIQHGAEKPEHTQRKLGEGDTPFHKDPTTRIDYAGDGGGMCDRIDVLIRHGSCDEKAVNDLLDSLPPSKAAKSSGASETLRHRLFLHFEQLKAARLAATIARLHPENKPQTCAPHLLPEKALPDLSLLDSQVRMPTNFDDYFADFINKICKGHTEKPDRTPQCQSEMTLTSGGAAELLRDHFNGPDKILPAGISYCARVLQSGPGFNFGNSASVISGLLNKPKLGRDCGPHGSIVIGRRLNEKTSKCEYLVRNSWGTSCDYYKPCKRWQTNVNQQPLTMAEEWEGSGRSCAERADKPAWECKDGSLWVDEETLTDNIGEVAWLH